MSFTHILPGAFAGWIEKQQVKRSIRFIQQHHTYSPAYKHFTGSNHIALQKGMQNFHKNMNGWQDIGQHFTIFPDGLILTGRSLNVSPACIFGANAGAICIENLGNFDTGGDEMRPEQREAIISVTAALCRRFNVPVNSDGIVYHHWFDLSTGKRTDGKGMTKTCPGTNFFGGNTVEAARAGLIADVAARLLPWTIVSVVDPLPEVDPDTVFVPEVIVMPDTTRAKPEPETVTGIGKENVGCLPAIIQSLLK